MKRVIFFFTVMLISWGALADSPAQYALQILEKDLPSGLHWFSKIAQSDELSQSEVYNLYQSALPEIQANKQQGVSVKGSIERMLILLDGARYFEQVQKAPLDFQNKKELVNSVLQMTKDEMDLVQYGKDPEKLFEERHTQGLQTYGVDFAKFSSDLTEVFTDMQRLLSNTETVASEENIDSQIQNVNQVQSEDFPEDNNADNSEDLSEESFEGQRLKSYIDSAEVGKVADECLSAEMWQTDAAESCQSDDSLVCDRSYARQCKKLQ